jgi:thioredoxin-related protein
MLLAWLCLMGAAQAVEPTMDTADFPVFDDQPLEEPLSHPDWFKLSFLELQEDLNEAVAANKRGLMIYFGQKYCAYCKALLETNFGKPDIKAYTQRHFEVIGIDIHGSRSVTDFEGAEGNERSYALKQNVNFTPTLLFYDQTGREALRLSGYYPPYQFRAALEYVADGHYLKEDFRAYLARADVPRVFEQGDLNFQEFFLPPPHNLSRTHRPGERPLFVFFEQPECHACDILHTGPLLEPRIVERLGQFETVQLKLWGDQPVITPDGKRTTDGAWATKLGLFYAPTLLFFDEHGREVLRLDSVVQFYRLRNALDYVASGAYKDYPTLQRWRDAQGEAVGD